jgi:hypothetical protein
MTHKTPLTPLASRRDETTLVVPRSASFLAFDQWMDAQLTELVAHWIHTAAPNAERQERISHRFSRQRDTF